MIRFDLAWLTIGLVYVCNGSKSDVKITQFGRLRVPVIPSLYNIVQSGGRLPRTIKIVGCRNATTVVKQIGQLSDNCKSDNCPKIETNRKH